MKKPKWCNLKDDSCWSNDKGAIKSRADCLYCMFCEGISEQAEEFYNEHILKPAFPHHPDMTGNCTNGQLKEQLERGVK